ncbi:MAG TPA: OmpA family protein [Candidatus Sulfotelmatobacter sp.]|jgi:outer membrane protein OmpA-like peptidoglycan-associated protein|nr:OmpA family protein [Candidatus Sulfotelmatobacter sp.]
MMLRHVTIRSPYYTRNSSNLRLAVFCLGLISLLGLVAVHASGQTFASSTAPVSRTTKAINYRRSGTTLKILFHGTDLMQQAGGEAKVENKGNRVEIEAKFEGLEDATKFGLEYLTYVLWAISPQGRAVNLGEVQAKDGRAQVKAISDMQTFGMIITAEPYFAVTEPSDEVVAENSLEAGAGGETIEARYELLARGVYSSSNTKIENAIFGIDRKTPVELFQARNAARIARNAGAEKYAGPSLAKAAQQLQSAEDLYRQKRDKKTVIAAARDSVQTAEEARVISVKRKAEEEAQAKAAAEKLAAEQREARARQDATDEMKRRGEAEQARQAAEAAKAEAERLKLEAQQAAADAAKAKQDAERARAAALADQQAALEQKRAAEADAVIARAAAAKAESEKAELRAQLLAQLNAVLQTNDSTRGLIVNMSDVLFDTGRYTLKPTTREKLAKISGIVLAHPGLTLQIEGHTDIIGGDDFNQHLSEQRAATVLDFLAEQGVPASSMTARGFGKTQPVASNDTIEGRQKNRRVELIVNGETIGGTASSTGASR